MTSNGSKANKNAMIKTIMNANSEGKDKTNMVLIISIIAIISILVLYFIITFFAKLPPFSSPSSPSEPIPIPAPEPAPEPTPQDEREETTFVHNMGAGGIFGSGPSLGLGGVAV